MQQMINKLCLNPKRIFLIDGIGALLTVFFLVAILSTFNEYFGMPQKILTILSVIGLFFCIYSISCFFFIKNNWRLFLKVIIIANTLYCCLTIALVIYFYQQLTILGISYFILEIFVVLGLVAIEIKTLAMNYQK